VNTTVNSLPTGACLVPPLPITRFKDAIFIPLPVELWRATPGGCCCCQFCKADGSPGFWDTLALGAAAPGNRRDDRTYTVHHPGLHAPHIRKEKAARAIASHAYNDLLQATATASTVGLRRHIRNQSIPKSPMPMLPDSKRQQGELPL
jgi:hypothetical protein